VEEWEKGLGLGRALSSNRQLKGNQLHVFRVNLQPSARAQITGELQESAYDLERGHETGGWLFGAAGEGWWGGITVCEATGPGENSVRAYGEMTLDRGYLHDLCELYRRESLELLGGWHVHVDSPSIPSSIDIDNRIAMVLDYRATFECRTQRALEIICSSEDGKTWTPEPWVFYRGPGGITGREGIWSEAAVILS
jgi:hypothetical protein